MLTSMYILTVVDITLLSSMRVPCINRSITNTACLSIYSHHHVPLLPHPPHQLLHQVHHLQGQIPALYPLVRIVFGFYPSSLL